MNKTQGEKLVGGLTSTSKMPCKSISLPTAACITGARMAEIAGSICSECYANKGFYKLYRKTIIPAQQRRLAAITAPEWENAMAAAIGQDKFFRWHDSGDVQSVEHLERIAAVARAPRLTAGIGYRHGNMAWSRHSLPPATRYRITLSSGCPPCSLTAR